VEGWTGRVKGETSMRPEVAKMRSVSRIVDSVRTVEGEGFSVRRPFPTRALDHVDPFLLLDEMGPADLGPGEAKGAPDHPHRGFETVTYVLDGRMEHKDSQGNAGGLGPGDVQWMTAGAGVVHSEMPEADFRMRGGRMHGFQLWVNLPQRDKMMRPRYQEVPADRIPVGRSGDGAVTVFELFQFVSPRLGEYTRTHYHVEQRAVLEIHVRTGEIVITRRSPEN